MKVNNNKMAKGRTSKTRTRNRNNGQKLSTRTKRKAKRVTPHQKLILHLNEALALENAQVQKTAVTNKTDKNRKCKRTTSSTPRRDKRAAG